MCFWCDWEEVLDDVEAVAERGELPEWLHDVSVSIRRIEHITPHQRKAIDEYIEGRL